MTVWRAVDESTGTPPFQSFPPNQLPLLPPFVQVVFAMEINPPDMWTGVNIAVNTQQCQKYDKIIPEVRLY
jgi:hypothetical protein